MITAPPLDSLLVTLVISYFFLFHAAAWEDVRAYSPSQKVDFQKWNKCFSQTDCDGCYDASIFCHWCSDGKCHPRLGFSNGCGIGDTCPRKDASDDDKEADEACAVHTACDECQASSNDCRWCSDNKCHAPKSVYGCAIPEVCPDDNGNKVMKNLQCARSTNCTSCKESPYDCNWCGKDNRCHAKGSLLGCEYSETCLGAINHTIEAMDSECQSSTNCTECALSSSRCHFCAFDNKCHAKGSVHGCSVGTTCYDAEQCVRKEPERDSKAIKEYQKHHKEKVIDGVLFHVFVVLSILCGLAVFFGGSFVCLRRFWKTKIEDSSSFADTTPLLEQNEEDGPSNIQMNGSDDPDKSSRLDTNPIASPSGQVDVENEIGPMSERTNESGGSCNRYMEVTDASIETQLVHIRSDQKKRLFESTMPGATLCLGILSSYFILIVLIILLLLLIFYPLQPSFDICGHSFDVKQILSTRFDVKLSFQVLASVYNPNSLNVELLHGSANVSHGGEHIGKVTIPSTQIFEGKALNDVILSVTSSLSRLRALQMYGEFMKGELQLNANIDTGVKVPALHSGFVYHLEMKNYSSVLSNSKLNRKELCFCNSTSVAELFSLLFDSILEFNQYDSIL